MQTLESTPAANEPLTPEPQPATIAGEMVHTLHKQKQLCDSLTDFIIETLRPHLAAFESGSAEVWSMKWYVHLHRPKTVEGAKAFCRAWGGNWKQTNDGSSVTYRCDDDRGTCYIHNVEAHKETPVEL